MIQGGGWGESLLASYIGPHLPILSLSILDSPFSRLLKLFAAASSNCAQGCRPELPAANRPCPSSQAPTPTLRQPISLSPRVPWRGDGPALPAGSPGSAQPSPCTGGVLGLFSVGLGSGLSWTLCEWQHLKPTLSSFLPS